MKIINIGNGKISIDTPYNPSFVQKIKQTDAHWNPKNKTWEAEERNINAIRRIMREVYGMDDLPQELVSVRVRVGDSSISALTKPVIMFGKTIASAFGRDSGARVGEGVCFESGKACSGGSVKNWHTTIEADSVFVIHDVPKAAVEQKLGWDDKYGTFEIIPDADPNAVLLAEKEALLKRLAEIDVLLQG